MIDARRMATASGLVFDVSVGGAEDAPLVLMPHGFCVSRHFWSNQIPALALLSWRTVSLKNSVRPEGAGHQWRKVPPGELSVSSGS
jgi:hypothetical protein